MLDWYILRSVNVLIVFGIRENSLQREGTVVRIYRFGIRENSLQREGTVIRIYRKGDKRDCNNDGGLSVLLSTYKILTSVLLSGLNH